MLKLLILFGTLIAPAHANTPVTYGITTVEGKTVKVTEEALRAAYSQMVQSALNNTFKNEDGSTSIVRPAVMVAGEAHDVSNTGGYTNWAVGLCKLRGYSQYESSEVGPMAPGPSVLLNDDGTINATYESVSTDIHVYRSITCR